MVSAGIAPGGYHKFGWTDPIAEADAFVNAMSPLEEGDVLAHDMEPASDVPIPANWSEFEQAYVQRVHDRTGVWSWRYENISMNNSMPKEGCVVNCLSWVAAPSFSWDATVPVNTPVVVQQGPSIHIPGITANVCDTDAFFGSGTSDQILAELRKTGYHSPTPPPATTQNPTPVTPTPTSGQGSVNTTPVPTPTELPATITTPPTSTPTTPQTNNNQTNTTQDGGTPLFFSQKTPPQTPPHTSPSPSGSWWSGILNIVLAIIGRGWLWGKTK